MASEYLHWLWKNYFIDSFFYFEKRKNQEKTSKNTQINVFKNDISLEISKDFRNFMIIQKSYELCIFPDTVLQVLQMRL